MHCLWLAVQYKVPSYGKHWQHAFQLGYGAKQHSRCVTACQLAEGDLTALLACACISSDPIFLVVLQKLALAPVFQVTEHQLLQPPIDKVKSDVVDQAV